MAASLGAYEFDGLIGPPPKLPEVAVDLFARPGSPSIGARIHPSIGMESQVQFLRIVNDSTRLSTQYSYRSAIGSVLAFAHKGVSWSASYSVAFLVLSVDIQESRTIPKACGIGPTGVAFDYSPAGRIISNWRLVAVPV